MTHLSEAEFVDLLDETLAPARTAHLDRCAACREQAAALGALLRDAAAVEIPEPSPLFWDHLQSRVREAVDAEPVHAAAGWSWSGLRLVPLGVVVALLLAVAIGSSFRERCCGSPSAPVTAAIYAPMPDPGVDATIDPADADVWDVLTSAAAIDEANGAGIRAQPAAVDHAVQRLSSAELTELGRLLQAELKRSSN
jgi:hypothetical protein